VATRKAKEKKLHRYWMSKSFVSAQHTYSCHLWWNTWGRGGMWSYSRHHTEKCA